MNETTLAQRREVADRYFHGRISSSEMQTLKEIANAYGTTPAQAMRIILQAVQVQQPVISFKTEAK